MKPYPEYKETGLSWLPKIPKHWELVRAKQLFKIIDIRSESGDEELLSVSERYGVVKRENVKVTMFMANSYEGYKLCWPNDLVVNSLWAWSYGLGFSQYHGIISTAYSVYRLKDKTRALPRYFDYFVRGKDFHWELRIRSKGLWKSRYQLSDDSFLSAPVILPPMEEQKRIVRYLDLMTAKIDKLIDAKKKQIALLQEKKQAIVNQVVTRGLNPDVQLKDSGIDWLGKIPAHWEVKKLRHLLHAVSEKNHPDSPLLSVVREKGVILRDIENKEENHNFIPEDLSNYKFVKKGQFVVNKMKAWQGSYGISSYEGIVSPAYFVFNLRGALPLFFQASIRSKFCSAQFARASDGIRVGQWDLSIPRMKEILFLEPPEEEQRAIVRYLDLSIFRINKILSAYKSQCRVLLEYKDKLVFSIVTGRLDVREMAEEEVKFNF